MSDYSEWQEARQLVGGHPEMRGVDLKRDDLIYFKADDAIREAVLGNDEDGYPHLSRIFLRFLELFLIDIKN